MPWQFDEYRYQTTITAKHFVVKYSQEEVVIIGVPASKTLLLLSSCYKTYLETAYKTIDPKKPPCHFLPTVGRLSGFAKLLPMRNKDF